MTRLSGIEKALTLTFSASDCADFRACPAAATRPPEGDIYPRRQIP